MKQQQKNKYIVPFICLILLLAGIAIKNGTIIGLAVAVGVIYVCFKFKIPHYTLFLFFLGLGIRIFFVFLIKPPLESDFRLLYQAADALSAGDVSILQNEYFSTWAYQSAFVAFQAFLLRIWHSPLFIKLINCFFSAGSACLIYQIAKKHIGEKAAQAASALISIFPLFVLLPTVLTNQISAGFFLLLGAFMLLGAKEEEIPLRRYIAAGACFQIGNLLRPEGMVLLAAFFAWAFFRLIFRKEAAKRILAGILMLFLVYSAIHEVADFAIRQSGINEYGLENKNSLWKFVVGFNHETGGGYSEEDVLAVQATTHDGMPTEETYALEKQIIKERLSVSPIEMMRLMKNKTKTLWCKDALSWIIGPFEEYPDVLWHEYKIADMLRQADRAIFYLGVLFAFIGIFSSKRTINGYFSILAVFAAYGAFLLVEVQPRYAYLPQLFLFICAGFGIEMVMNKLGMSHEKTN